MRKGDKKIIISELDCAGGDVDYMVSICEADESEREHMDLSLDEARWICLDAGLTAKEFEEELVMARAYNHIVFGMLRKLAKGDRHG